MKQKIADDILIKTQPYLKDKKVLIVDPSTSFAAVVADALCSFGCEKVNIQTTTNFEKGQIALKLKPQIIITEFQIEGRNGLEFVPVQQEYCDEPNQRVFMIITANSSDSAVAEAAEEDVDGYLLKPFSMNQLVEVLTKVLLSKIQISPYLEKIRLGQNALKDGDIVMAEKYFLEAKTHNNKPTLACYYSGYTGEQRKQIPVALQRYREGLTFNQIHYKCLIGEFSILYQLDKKNEAYESLKKVKTNFPMTSQLLDKMFRLAIFTQHFDDLEECYQLYTKLERRPETLTKVVSAALFAGGKFSLRDGKIDEAITFFKRALAASGQDFKLLKEIILYFMNANCLNEAQTFFKMFPPQEVGSAFYVQLDFMISKRQMNPSQIVNKGREIIQKGLATPEIFLEVINHLKTMDSKKTLENVCYKAAEQFPDMKSTFFNLMEMPSPASVSVDLGVQGDSLSSKDESKVIK